MGMVLLALRIIGPAGVGLVRQSCCRQVVVFSAGYRNRFNHPHPDVTGRIDSEGLPYVNTATSGLIEITPEGQIKLMRAQWMPRWHAPPDAERDFSLHGHVLE